MEYDIHAEKCPYCGASNEWVKDNPSSSKDTHLQQKERHNSKKEPAKLKRSSWYTFATIMMILGAVAVVVTFGISLSDWHHNWTPFYYTLGGYLLELGFWAIVQLLADIKLGIDKLLAQQKK